MVWGYEDSALAEAVVVVVALYQVGSNSGPHFDVVDDGSIHVDIVCWVGHSP